LYVLIFVVTTGIFFISIEIFLIHPYFFILSTQVNIVQEVGHVENIDYLEDGTYMQARVPESVANRLRPFYVNDVDEVSQNDTSEEEEIDWVAIGRGRHSNKDA
jgi:hypothetical protein